MSAVDILFAGVPVTRFAAAVAWYTQVFGRPADIVVNQDEVMWRFADPAWLYVVRDPGRAGHALVTLCVADLDRAVADIAARGITGAPAEPVGDAGRKARYTDPDGNSLAFIQVTGAA